MSEIVIIINSDFSIDPSRPQATGHVRARLNRQEHRHSIHFVPRSQPLPHIHERLLLGVSPHTSKARGDVEDLDAVRARLVGRQACFSGGCDSADRDRSHQSRCGCCCSATAATTAISDTSWPYTQQWVEKYSDSTSSQRTIPSSSTGLCSARISSTQPYAAANIEWAIPGLFSQHHCGVLLTIIKGPPPVQHYPQQYHQQPQHGPPGPAPGSYHQPYPPTPQPNPNFHTYNNPGHDVYLLNMDIERLIKQARIDFGANVHDTSIQTRLKALLDLQGILQKQQLPPSDIKMIRDQVNALSHPPPMPPVPTPQPFSMAGPVPQPAYSQYPQVQSPYLQQAAQQNNAFNHLQPPAQVPSTQAPDLSSLLASNNLAAILAKAQRSTPTPPQSYAQLAMSVTTASAPVAIPAAIAGPGALPGSDLMASLRAAGLVISDQNAGNGTGFAPVTPPVGFSALSSSLPMNDLDLTSASLKRYVRKGPLSLKLLTSVSRTHIELVAHLYEARPNQCTTCGRRFLATNDGRQQKAHHLDWHFRTNQRIADASKRGQSRSWYVDELVSGIGTRVCSQILTICRIGSNRRTIRRIPCKLQGHPKVDSWPPQQRPWSTRNRNTSQYPQIKRLRTFPAPFARRSSKQCGMRMLRTSYGWMQFESAHEFTMLPATATSRKMVGAHRSWVDGLGRLIVCLARGRRVINRSKRARAGGN